MNCRGPRTYSISLRELDPAWAGGDVAVVAGRVGAAVGGDGAAQAVAVRTATRTHSAVWTRRTVYLLDPGGRWLVAGRGAGRPGRPEAVPQDDRRADREQHELRQGALPGRVHAEPAELGQRRGGAGRQHAADL